MELRQFSKLWQQSRGKESTMSLPFVFTWTSLAQQMRY
jgi:hypothetical protein